MYVKYSYDGWGNVTKFEQDRNSAVGASGSVDDYEVAYSYAKADAERALRHVVTGRKNWLFFGSPRGAEVGANLFSLVASCKALGVNPEAYLEDVLRRVDTTPASEIASLTPWAWARDREGAKSV